MYRVSLLAVAFGTTTGNFIAQLIGDMNWATAFERSFFQCTALLIVYGLAKFNEWQDAA